MFGIPNRRIVLHKNSHHPLPWLHKALGPADGISSIAGAISGRREAAIAAANTKSPEQVLLQKQPGEPRPRKIWTATRSTGTRCKARTNTSAASYEGE
jgi:hypothetical protein